MMIKDKKMDLMKERYIYIFLLQIYDESIFRGHCTS